MSELKMGDCPQCNCALFQVYKGDDGEPAKLECNMCGHAFPVNAPRLLTLNRLILLSDLDRGVQAKVKLRYWPNGTETDKPAEYTLRAFTHDGGGFLREDEDVRDAFVWCSGIFEHWFPVEELLDALDNITTGRHGMDKPMASIDWPEEGKK